MNSSAIRSIILTTVLLLALSCTPFKPEIRKSPEGLLPERFSLNGPQHDPSKNWWEAFNDPELNLLVEEALAASLTLEQAFARLSQARALAVQAGAALYPELTGNADAAYARQHFNGVSRDVHDYSLGLFSSYELDLWGRVRSQRQTFDLEASATREDLSAAAITLSAEVVLRWANIISQRMQKRLLQRQLETNLIFLELVELRFRKAIVSALDVYQQKQVVEQVKAELPLVEAQEQLLLHELALLLGKPPRAHLEINRTALPVPESIPATGLPADLLATRPDIRAAALRLQASDWQVAAAKADRLPAIRLSAGGNYEADKFGQIFDNWLLNLAAGVTAPVFDGHRRTAEVKRTQAVVHENLARFRETVLTAVKEVEDALVSETKQQEHIQGLELQMNAARKALEQAILRYRRGVDEYLPVLTQLLAVQRLERDLIQRQTELLADRINLYRALGGTWANRWTPDAG